MLFTLAFLLLLGCWCHADVFEFYLTWPSTRSIFDQLYIVNFKTMYEFDVWLITVFKYECNFLYSLISTEILKMLILLQHSIRTNHFIRGRHGELWNIFDIPLALNINHIEVFYSAGWHNIEADYIGGEK